MKLPSKVKFFDERTKFAFEELEHSTTEDRQLFKFLSQAFENLEENAFAGIQIPKKQIPKEFLKRYGIDNCWKYNLPSAWRLLYTVSRDKVFVLSIVLEWDKHKEYDRKFKYKRR